MRFVLLDETSGVPTAQGLGLSGSALADIAHACSVQLNRDYSTHWGGNFEVRAGAGAGDIQPGEVVFAVLQTLPDAPGEIAYHDVDGNGVPTLFDGITLSDTLVGSGNSLSVAISHELLETAGDAGCNLWADGGDGNEYAHELCDAVESQTYAEGGVYVSNFVIPAFFVPGSAGPYDHMSYALLSGATGPAKPLATAGGGYQIVRSAGAGEHQVQALTSEGATRFAARAPKRARPESRQSRRGLR
jgi:hypothetical protein